MRAFCLHRKVAVSVRLPKSGLSISGHLPVGCGFYIRVYCLEAEAGIQRKSLLAQAFSSVSGIGDGQVAFDQIIEALKCRKYESFRLETLVVEGESHTSGVWFAFSKAVRVLYKRICSIGRSQRRRLDVNILMTLM
jgi:hypothetical protein